MHYLRHLPVAPSRRTGDERPASKLVDLQHLLLRIDLLDFAIQCWSVYGMGSRHPAGDPYSHQRVADMTRLCLLALLLAGCATPCVPCTITQTPIGIDPEMAAPPCCHTAPVGKVCVDCRPLEPEPNHPCWWVRTPPTCQPVRLEIAPVYCVPKQEIVNDFGCEGWPDTFDHSTP